MMRSCRVPGVLLKEWIGWAHLVNLFCLRDVPNVGVKLPWASNRSDGLVTYEHLDRAMSNLEWI